MARIKNHDEWIRRQMRKDIYAESRAARLERLSSQGGTRAYCGSIFSDKRKKKLEKAMLCE